MNKNGMALLVQVAAYFSAIYFLIGAPVWLAMFLAVGVCSSIELSRRAREYKILCDITDAQLVYVSAKVEDLEHSLAVLGNQYMVLVSRLEYGDLSARPSDFSRVYQRADLDGTGR